MPDAVGSQRHRYKEEMKVMWNNDWHDQSDTRQASLPHSKKNQ